MLDGRSLNEDAMRNGYLLRGGNHAYPGRSVIRRRYPYGPSLHVCAVPIKGVTFLTSCEFLSSAVVCATLPPAAGVCERAILRGCDVNVGGGLRKKVADRYSLGT